jgi:HAD superfamily hydrolase (TIGR01458 family)
MEDPNCVLVGLAPNAFNYDKLNEAFRLLMKIKTASTSSLDTPHLSEEGINPLIAIHKGKYFKEEDGNLSLGPGPFVTALEYATGFEAVVVGKPCKDFFLEAAHSLGIQPSELVMIGDDVEQDILGSLQAGIGHAVLVKTGKYIPGDEQKIESYQNSSVVDSITNAVENIILNYSLK